MADDLDDDVPRDVFVVARNPDDTSSLKHLVRLPDDYGGTPRIVEYTLKK